MNFDYIRMLTYLEIKIFITKVLKLVEVASSKKSHTEEFIGKFAKGYTPIVIILALLLVK